MLINAPLRKIDKWGDGSFGAPRGSRTHKGVDIACYKGTKVLSICEGEVSKIGFPYSANDPKKSHYRYVEVKDHLGFRFRYFYVDPAVKVGDPISKFQKLGVTQGLEKTYPGITDHFHFEIIDAVGNVVDPHEILGEQL